MQCPALGQRKTRRGTTRRRTCGPSRIDRGADGEARGVGSVLQRFRRRPTVCAASHRSSV